MAVNTNLYNYIKAPDVPFYQKPSFVVGAVLVAYLVFRVLRSGRRDPRMPPGPPTVPIFGNALQIPPTGIGKKYESALELDSMTILNRLTV